MKLRYLAFYMCMFFLLTGCQVIPPLNINEINMVQGMGFDKASDGKLEGTILYPEYKPDETSEVKVLKAKGETVRKIIDLTKNQVEYPLVNGQLRVVLFGKDIAEEGVYPLIDTFGRSPSIGNLLQLAVVDGKASELLSLKSAGKKNIPLYLQEMIEQNIDEGELPSTDLTVFEYKFFDDGSDPYLPLLKKEKDHFEISGIALFKDDRLKTTLPKKDLFILKMLEEKFKMGAQQFQVGDDEFVVVGNIKASPKYKVEIHNGIPQFLIKIKMNARIQEYTGKKHTNLVPKINEFEKEIQANIEKDAQRIIKIFQNNEVDPLGLGAKYEAHYRDFKLQEWEALYPEVKVNVHVDLNIQHTGIIE
jgi:spore germination protein